MQGKVHVESQHQCTEAIFKLEHKLHRCHPWAPLHAIRSLSRCMKYGIAFKELVKGCSTAVHTERTVARQSSSTDRVVMQLHSRMP